MKKTTTLLLASKVKQEGLRPKKSTIEGLKQFARAYTYDSRMPKNLEVFIIN